MYEVFKNVSIRYLRESVKIYPEAQMINYDKQQNECVLD